MNGLTLGYNVARLHEANGESKQAQTFYSVCQPSHQLHGCIYMPCCLLSLLSFLFTRLTVCA